MIATSIHDTFRPEGLYAVIEMSTHLESRLSEAAEKAISLAKKVTSINQDILPRHRFIIMFEVNGIICYVAADSDPELVLRDYFRAIDDPNMTEIGPDYKATLSAAELARDQELQAKRAAKIREEQRLSAEKQLRAARHLCNILANAPQIIPINNPEDYKAACAKCDRGAVQYAEKLILVSEFFLTTGNDFETAANQANRLVDAAECTSGSIWGEAMQLACRFWTRGEELQALWLARKI